MKVYVLVQVDEEVHETEGCECGCGEGWETNYQTHCSVIKVSTNREKLEVIKLDAEKQNKEITEYNQKVSEEHQLLVQAENARVNALYSEQMVRYRQLFTEYKDTVNKGLTLVGKELYSDNTREVLDWFGKKISGTYHDNNFYQIFYKHQARAIITEFFNRFPDLKLNDKDLGDLREDDLKGYQRFQKTQFPYPTLKPFITPYQIIEKELED